MDPVSSHIAPPRPPARGNALPSVRVGLQALRVNPLRTFLSALGVVIGVASLVAVLSLGDGMERFARDEIERTTSLQNVSIDAVAADTLDGVPVPRQEVLVFGEAEARAFAEARVPGFAGAFISAYGTTTVRGPDGRMRGARVRAVTAGADEFHGLVVKWGRFFSADEAAANAPVAVVSHPLALAVAGGADAGAAIGKTVEMRGGARKIVGVLEDRPDAPGLSALVPLAAATAVLMPGEGDGPRPLLLKARSVEEVPALKAGTERWLAARYGPGWRRDFTVGTSQARVEQVMRAMLLFKVFMGAITAISLLVGGIGIMNVLLASVTERTREIGIRKAVGARRRDIVLQFLSESVAITGSGSLVGLLLGLAAAFAITALMRAQVEAPVHAGLSLSTLAVAALSALVIGITFGTYPALRAARLSPIDAIRHE